MKMCEQILKKKTAHQYNSNCLNCNNTIQILWIVKRQRPNTIQIPWIVKNQERPIIAPAIAVRLLKKHVLQLLLQTSFENN